MKLFALITLVAASFAASASAAGGPRVALVQTSPLLVAGAGFDRSAPVRVTVVYDGARVTKTVRSTSTGSFTARWTAISLPAQDCGSQVILAATSAHRTVSVKSVPSVDGCGAQRVTP